MTDNRQGEDSDPGLQLQPRTTRLRGTERALKPGDLWGRPGVRATEDLQGKTRLWVWVNPERFINWKVTGSQMA